MSLGPIALSAFIAFGQAADAKTTLDARRLPGFYETNGLMQDQRVMVGAKTAFAAAGIFAVTKAWKHSKPLAVGLAIGIGGAGFLAARQNQRAIARAR